MEYTSCEKLMWFVLANPTMHFLKKHKEELRGKEFKQRFYKTYREMIARTPDIGRLKENSLRICLAGGAVWLSAYEAADGAIDEKLFSEMVPETMKAPILQMSFKMKKKSAFTIKSQTNRKTNADKSNLIESTCNWNTEVIPGHDCNEYTIIYHKCGLCGLGEQEGLFHLVKHMCVLDFMSVELMGGTLFRTQTLANNGTCCDFYIAKKGSIWEKQRTMQDLYL